MIKYIITWLITNIFTWTALVGIILGVSRKPHHMNKYASTLSYMFLWYVCFAFIWSGLFHLLLPGVTAAKIGWPNSPFQLEVGLANLSIALLGAMAFFHNNKYFWLGTIGALAIFTGGAGVNHVYQLIVDHNHAVSNSGLLMWTDMIVPVIMLIFCIKAKIYKKQTT